MQPYRDPRQQPLRQRGIALLGDALIAGIEVVVVVGEAHRQTPDDEGRQLRAGTAPLLLGVALHQLFIDVTPHQTDGLLLQIPRLAVTGGRLLAAYLLPRLLRRDDTPHLVEGVHVEGQVIQLAPVVGDGAVGKAVEAGKAVDVGPHLLIVGVEDVRAVAVNVDALHRLGVGVAGNMAAPVNDKAFPPRIRHFAGKHRAEQAGAHDEIVELPAHITAVPRGRGRHSPGRQPAPPAPSAPGCGAPPRGRR